MSAPDPDSFSWITKIAAGLAAIVSPVIWVHRRLDKKADKAELTRCLDHIEKLYENAEVDRKLTRDLHDSAMHAIQENYHEIVKAVYTRMEK